MSAQHFLKKHPTPWRFICETDLSDTGEKSEFIAYGYHDARQCDQEVRDVVEDANGNIVFASWDHDETASHIDGDVRGLVDFVNLVGEDYEPQHGRGILNPETQAGKRERLCTDETLETVHKIIRGDN